MEFANVRIVKKANVYYEGKVTSRTVYFEDGSNKTLGFMLAGEYEFRTDCEEITEVIAGEMQIMKKGENDYTNYREGQSFTIPAHSEFHVIIGKFADYCCSYR